MTWQAIPWQSSLQAAFTTIWGSGVSPIPSLDLNFISGSLDPKITYTGASLSTLTNAAGAIAYKPHNLLTYSEQFDNAGWAKLGATVSANQTIAPTGSSTADLLVESATSAPHFAYYSLGGTSSGVDYTLSVKLKAAGRSWVALRCGKRARFNLSTGVIGTVESGGAASIVSEGNGWYTCSVKGQFGFSGTNEFYVMLADNDGAADPSYTGDGTSGVYVWGTQLNVGPLQPYYPTTSAAYYGPRFTYDPVTHAALGLLIEEQRTNLLTQSGDMTNAAWTATNATTAAGSVLGPDGSTLLTRITSTNAAGTRVQQLPTVASGASYSITFYMAAGTSAFGGIVGSVGASAGAIFGLSGSGSVVNTTGCTATISLHRTGLYKCTVTLTTTGTTLLVGAGPSDGSTFGSSFYPSGAVSSTIEAGFAQLEAGAFATSYIPTTSASVTRAADSATMTGSNFSSWFNATQGTFVAEYTLPAGYATSANNAYFIGVSNAAAGAFAAIVGSGKTVTWDSTTEIDSVASFSAGRSRFAIALTPTTRVICLNAAMPVSGAHSGYLLGVSQISIGSGYSSSQVNAPIARLRYYPTALTNAQLQALTT